MDSEENSDKLPVFILLKRHFIKLVLIELIEILSNSSVELAVSRGARWVRMICNDEEKRMTRLPSKMY